jgi:hypothetical protein
MEGSEGSQGSVRAKNGADLVSMHARPQHGGRRSALSTVEVSSAAHSPLFPLLPSVQTILTC